MVPVQIFVVGKREKERRRLCRKVDHAIMVLEQQF